MKKRNMKVKISTLATFGMLVLISVAAYPVYGNIADAFQVYLPVVVRPESTPTPTSTPEPTPTDTPTPIPDPIPDGSSIHFMGWENNVPFSGVVVNSEFQQSLTPNYGSPVMPLGKFLVVVMDVTNNGLESDSAGRYSAFAVKDSEERQFDMAELTVQWAAEDQYDLEGVYTDIQPGFTIRHVFVFDVLPNSQIFTLVSLSSW